MDIEAIASPLWRRLAMLAWVVPGLLWYCVIQPFFEAAVTYWESLCYTAGALRGFPAEFKRVWG